MYEVSQAYINPFLRIVRNRCGWTSWMSTFFRFLFVKSLECTKEKLQSHSRANEKFVTPAAHAITQSFFFQEW